MPSQHTDVIAIAVREEQDFLDAADRRRRELIASLRTRLRSPVEDRVDEQRHALLAARVRALTDAAHGLVLGRIDTAEGVTHRIGPVGIPHAEGDAPLVLDWRADAARPFYTATALEPHGLRRRRHIRTRETTVTGVDDEDLGHGSTGGMVGEAALLAALDERRTGRMGTAVATLQREQDAIIRAAADAPLVVQGGPGTGKTVVALHRVAYLLFSRPEIARRGVLLLGPSRRFLDYVEQVLPALGETAVVSTTCDDLVPGATLERAESRDVAEIKGRPCWWDALVRLVDGLAPDAHELSVDLDGETYPISTARLTRVLRAARSPGRSLLAARAFAFGQLRELLVEEVIERTAALLSGVEEGLEDVLGGVDRALARSDDRGVRTETSSSQVDGEMSEDDIETLRTRVDADPRVRAALEQWWPVPAPRDVLEELLHDAGTLSRLAPELTAAEIEAVTREPAGLAPSDMPLLDALTALIGTTETQASQAARDAPPFLADRAAADHGWTYGHVVVDEAQELSAMQWHMVRRRCPTGSITAVGDIDQTEAPHRHVDWAQAITPVLGRRWRRRDLTICYRTPREVMALVGAILARAGSGNEPPRAVRSSGREPRELSTDSAGLATLLRTELDALTGRYRNGSTGVVTPRRHHDRLRAALPDVPVVSAREAKGLEWDACVVVDPAEIAAEPRGWNALYVAVTRCTQELLRVHVR